MSTGKRGRPRLNESGVMKPVRGRISEEDLELLAELGYSVGDAIRGFCAMKRRTMLSAMSSEQAEEMLRKEEKIQRESKSREQDLLNELKINADLEAENTIVKGDIVECKLLTVKRLNENKLLFLKHGAGYKEVLRKCMSALPEEVLSCDSALAFFDNYRGTRKKPPTLGDIEGLIY